MTDEGVQSKVFKAIYTHTVKQARADVDAMLTVCRLLHEKSDRGEPRVVTVSYHVMHMNQSIQMALMGGTTYQLCLAGCTPKPGESTEGHAMASMPRVMSATNLLHGALNDAISAGIRDAEDTWDRMAEFCDAGVKKMAEELEQAGPGIAERISAAVLRAAPTPAKPN